MLTELIYHKPEVIINFTIGDISDNLRSDKSDNVAYT